MYLDFVLSGMQVVMFALKLLDRFDKSWRVVFLPSIAWAVIGLLLRLNRLEIGKRKCMLNTTLFPVRFLRLNKPELIRCSLLQEMQLLLCLHLLLCLQVLLHRAP